MLCASPISSPQRADKGNKPSKERHGEQQWPLLFASKSLNSLPYEYSSFRHAHTLCPHLLQSIIPQDSAYKASPDTPVALGDESTLSTRLTVLQTRPHSQSLLAPPSCAPLPRATFVRGPPHEIRHSRPQGRDEERRGALGTLEATPLVEADLIVVGDHDDA